MNQDMAKLEYRNNFPDLSNIWTEIRIWHLCSSSPVYVAFFPSSAVHIVKLWKNRKQNRTSFDDTRMGSHRRNKNLEYKQIFIVLSLFYLNTPSFYFLIIFYLTTFSIFSHQFLFYFLIIFILLFFQCFLDSF